MMDRRLCPANARVAACELEGTLVAERYVEGVSRRVAASVTNLLDAPGGKRERQLLCGDQVRVLETHDGFAFLQSQKDGYVGYVDTDHLTTESAPTHRVTARATHLYPAPDLKQQEGAWLSYGSLLTIIGKTGRWSETDQGMFVYSDHLSPMDVSFTDPVTTAELFLGTPYLWGGNSSAGIDCSGLVQAALLGAGIPCPGDSDLQRDELGRRLPDDTAPQRGDLFFWKGHVAIAADDQTFIHANAHHMAVAYEPISEALERIAAKEFGALLAHKRLD